jgi:hypothetical protein
MKHIKKQAMTLALLLVAATGAWAQDDIQVTQVQGQANQWQYTMPDIDVELTINYFPTATFSEGGEPTAIEGVVAGTDNPIVTAASQQGTVMYYATTDVNAPAPGFDAAGWTSTVPTAAIVEGDKTESTRVYVFYYLKGNDAPEGQAATADNTFTDTEIFGPLTVTLKKNVFTVALRPLTQFNADGGQATVTVDGQPIDNFMLKLGKTITVTAAEGYKIRMAKMGDAAIPVGEVTKGDLGKLVGERGYIYADMAAANAASDLPEAQIVYVGSNTGVEDYDRGLAIYLRNNDAANIPGTHCCQPSKAQWETMFEAAGGYQALNEGMIAKCGYAYDFLGPYNDFWGSQYYYSTDKDSNGKAIYFNFDTGDWENAPGMPNFRNILAIAPAALSGEDATLNDARTVAIYTVPDHDATVKYLLARDLTYQVAFAGIPTEPVSVTMGPDGNYQPATPLDIHLNDAIANADIISADGLTVSYEKQDGDTWTAADDFLTNMQPGTYRVVAAATDEMSPYPYDGTLTSATTFTLTDNGIRLDEAADNSPALAKKDGQQTNVSLTRTLQTGGYNTFAVPFSMAKPEGWTVKELSSASFADGLLTLNFTDAASIVAGKPYLVKVGANTNLSASAFTDVTISKDAVSFTSTNVDFIPTLGATTIGSEGDDAKTVLFLGAGNKLYNPEALPADMKGFRAYFQLKGETAKEARAFRMDFGDGETTGIREMEDGKWKMENGSYDLQGRRVESSIFRSASPLDSSKNSQSSILKKGVYIVNGKKKVIK